MRRSGSRRSGGTRNGIPASRIFRLARTSRCASVASGTATVVHVEDGKTLTTDGPFAETKEVLGGYYLIDVDTLDEALEWAAKIPSARYGHIEVRPIVMREAEVAS